MQKMQSRILRHVPLHLTRVVFPRKSCPQRFTYCLFIQEQNSSLCGQTIILCDTSSVLLIGSCWFSICCCPCRNQYHTWLDLRKKGNHIPFLIPGISSENTHFPHLYMLCSSRFAATSFTSWRLLKSGTQLWVVTQWLLAEGRMVAQAWCFTDQTSRQQVYLGWYWSR